jgi:hypothetical protein
LLGRLLLSGFFTLDRQEHLLNTELVNTSLDLFFGEFSEPAFDLIDP